MAWEHLSITRPHLVYIILGGFTSLFMLCSSVIKERMYIGEATVATIVGVIFGPHAADLINPLEWGNTDIVTLEFSRIVLVVQCFAIGVELPKYYMERHWRSVIFLLIPVMTFGWLITSLFVWWMVPKLNWLDSLVVAACVTATDPVLASSVVGKGKFAQRVPKHIRDLLSAESGCNDGMAFPFVYLALYLISGNLEAGPVTFHWLCYTILYECLFGGFLGFVIGYVARHAIKFSEERELIDRESFLVFYFVLSLFCAGVGSMLGVDDLLVGFAAGVGFSNDGWFHEKTEESHVSNVIDLLLNLSYFVYLGTIIPWSDFNDSSIGLSAWRLVVIALMVIFFRRLPIMLALKPVIPDIKTWREALFAGHFGPIGVGAIFVALLARGELATGHSIPEPELPPKTHPNYDLIRLIWPIVTFIVIASIIVHGSSIAVFALGKRINTLSLTMSYTQGGEDGPTWMNRLPRLSSQSKSQMKTMSDTEGEDMPQVPPGTLPPIGLPGNFLRRQRDEEATSRNGSRASSRVSRRRKKKKWDDGIGPGGPVQTSAIFPEKRTSELLSPSNVAPPVSESDVPAEERVSSSNSVVADNADERTPIPSEESRVEKEAEGAPLSPKISAYEEGSQIVFEDPDGDVLAVADVKKFRSRADSEDSSRQSPSTSGPVLTPEAMDKVKDKSESTGQPVSMWSLDQLKGKVNDVYRQKMEKRKQKTNEQRKHEPARAFRIGNTVIVEDADGEVLKTYPLTSERQGIAGGELMSQGLKYIGLGKVISNPSAAPAEGSDRGRGKSKAEGAGDEEEDDDRHIRFTIGGEGRRLTKEAFIEAMQKLDSRTRKEVVDQSTASLTVKRLATQEPAESAPADTTGAGQTGSAPTKPGPMITTTLPTPQSDVSSGLKVPPQNRRLAALSSSTAVDDDDDEETPAERRRREAALGMTSNADDSDEEDTPRVPPAERRGIRFAEALERGRKRE
ncbi:hypothetical protein jhhlp_000101 [Lomentospora prolificans]|uniref:Na(+)/H(+) antiporter n=1 Tax=Lomentospora prolificans TaxID=41688 RepID=A0A2N3NLK9_9PEZI|nr:hypothetical protein jhhlp_000101 [Lomentospora prolificans]